MRPYAEARAKSLHLEEPFDSLLYFGKDNTKDDDGDGIITELTTSNIAIFLKDDDDDDGKGTWITPSFSPDHPFLRGVMRQELLDRGWIHERTISVREWKRWAREGRPMVGLNGLR